jgi:hypothetical protein
MGSNRSRSWQAAVFVGFAAALLGAACTQELPPRTTVDLMEDPAILQAVISRCNEMQSAALGDRECRNAREAVRRLEEQQGSPKKTAADQEFERAREARRVREELRRRHEEEREKVDPYTMPLAPDMVSPPAAVTQSTPVLAAPPTSITQSTPAMSASPNG